MKKYVCFFTILIALSSFAQDTDFTSSNESNNQDFGKLDAIQKSQFFGLLEKITSKKINIDTNTIIHFYQDDSPDLTKIIKHKKYWKWIKRNPKKVNTYLICSKESSIDVDRSKKLYVDNYDIIERLFLNNSNSNINHIIIQPDGSFKVIYGITNILRLLDSAI